MATISSLFVELKLQAENFNNGLRAAQQEAKELEKTVKPSKEALKEMGIVATAAGGAVVGALILMTKQAADYADGIRDAAIRTNTTTKEMSTFKYLAEQSGTSIEALQKGLIVLSKNAFSGSEAFKRLGIETKDSSGQIKSSKDLFAEVTSKLAQMKDSTAKTGITMELFGKSGVELTEILKGGRAAIDAATRATERFGIAVSQDTADNADKFNDTLNDMKQAQLGLSLAVSTALLPALTMLAETVTSVIIVVQQWTNAHPGLVQAVGALGLALTGGGGVILGLSGVLAILPKLTVAFMLLTGPIGLTIAAVVALVAGFIIFRNEIASGVMKSISVLVETIGDLIGFLARVSGDLGLSGLSAKLSGVRDRAIDTSNSLNVLGSSFLETTGVTVGNTKAVDDWIKKQEQGTDQLGETETALKKTKEAGDKLWKDMLTMQERWLGMADAAAVRMLKQNSANDDITAGLKKAASTVELVITNHKKMTEAGDALWKTLIDHAADYDKVLMDLRETGGSVLQRQVEAGLAANDKIAKEIIDKHKKVKEEGEKEYKRLFDSVKETASRTFSDIFEDGKFKFKALSDTIQGIFVTLANQILSEMTAKLITPLVARISGALSGLLGKIPGLGGIFGTVAGGVGGGVGVPGTAGAVGAAGTGPGSFGAFMANPWTIGIGAAVAGAIAVVKSQAHHEATTFVREFQNPFNVSIGNIHDAFYEAYRTGNLTVDAARDAREQVIQLWKEFQERANAFARKGRDEERVVQQAFATTTAVWGRDLSLITSGMQDVFDALTRTTVKTSDQVEIMRQRLVDAGITFATTGDALEALGISFEGFMRSVQEQMRPPIPDVLPFVSSLPAPPGSITTTTGGTTAVQNFMGLTPYLTPTGYVLIPRTSSSQPQVAFPTVTRYQGGTDYVPQSGIYHLEQGEAVVPASNKRGWGNITINAYQQPGEDQASFVRRLQEALRSNRYGMRDSVRAASR